MQSSPCSVWDGIVNWLTLSKQEILKLIKEMSLYNLDKAEGTFFSPFSLCTVRTLGACHRLVLAEEVMKLLLLYHLHKEVSARSSGSVDCSP